MTPAEREALLQQPWTAVLSTLDAQGRIHAVPVWYRWDGAAFRIITDRGSQKHRNVQRTGRASLCVDERDGAFRYLAVEGPVEVVDPVTYDERLALHTRYRGGNAARKIVDRGGHERMVLLVLTPERWLPSR
jgi:PPOX class probable F420-dependent enzyme